MSQLIYFNFINIDNENFFNTSNSIIRIKKINENGLEIFNSEYYIKYNLETNTLKKIYYIEVFDLDVTTLVTNNFNLELSNYLYKYAYFNDNINKSLIIYNKNNYFQFVYLGLPNLKNFIEVIINYTYFYVGNLSELESGPVTEFDTNSQNIMMLNNYQGINNYLQNTIFLDGTIYKLYIDSTGGIVDPTISLNNNYKLFKIDNYLNLDVNTYIYFYNNINTFSYILYLNSYNFTEYKTFPENYESIILLIEYVEFPGNVYIKYTQAEKYYYQIDVSGNENKIDLEIDTLEIKYSVVLSLNLQTFNSVQLNTSNTNEYYNVLFFKNYVNQNYIVKSITMFDCDYNKYFVNNFKFPEFYNISEYNIDLYDKIILNDINLLDPTILDLNYSYLFMNFDLINLINLIKYNCENNYIINFLKSNKITLDTLISYLANFEFINYNIYKIINIDNEKINNLYMNRTINILGNSSNNNYNYNYLYDNKKTYENKYNNNLGIINFNNNIMNSIRCKIVFLLGKYGYYSFYGKLYLSNYNIEIYHKKYNIDELDKKKSLINLLLYLASFSWGIKIILYNEIASEPKVSSFYNYYLGTNPYYLFNDINLTRKLNNFDTYLNITSLDNNYKNQYLKFNLEIRLKYYILFFYSDKNSILRNYDELVFNYSQYVFKIFKNKNINGNTDENKDLFFIGFQDLKQLNIFMKYLTTGIFNTNLNNLSNYFNINKSVIFCNYYNINNYWVLNSLKEPIVPNGNPNILDKNKIYFSINNLSVNQIYLQGDLSIINDI